MLSEKEQLTDTARFWQFIRAHFKTLFIYAFIGGALAGGLTFFVPKEYKSYGIVYPPSSPSIDNSIDYPNFGYDVEADRLIQIFESREIRDSVIRKFNLAGEFDVDPSAADWMDKMVKLYFKNIKFERTPSMAILISARTKSPELSANIVNYIINSVDPLREKIYKKNIVPAYESAKADYDMQKRLVDSTEIVLAEKLKQNNLSSLLMLMSDAQINIDLDKLNANSGSASAAMLGADIIAFKSMYDVLKEYKARYIKIRKTYTNPIPKMYVINYGEPNYKKISPSFTVNIAFGILFALFVAMVVLLPRYTRESH